MSNEKTNHFKLGVFVLAGTAVLIAALYLIGSKRNVFSSTISVSAVFYNVNGLMPGNNVRYGGIDIGTVDKLLFENDTSITVKMVIEKRIAPFIKKNAIASIGTDGLMGNKLVNINSVSTPSSPIVEGDVLLSQRPVETDEMVRTLNETNKNIEVITSDLRDITQRINKNNNLLSLFSDTVVTDKLRTAIHSLSDASANANAITRNVNLMVAKVQAGEGVLGSLINDSSSEKKVRVLLENLSVMSDTLKAAVSNLNTFSDNLNSKQGVIYSLSKDSILNTDLKETIAELNKSSVILTENLKAMQKNFLFRKYFRQKEKAQKGSVTD